MGTIRRITINELGNLKVFYDDGSTLEADTVTEVVLSELLKSPGWQLCPKCKGSKCQETVQSQKENAPNPTYTTCVVCEGAGILNIVTGKPPKK